MHIRIGLWKCIVLVVAVVAALVLAARPAWATDYTSSANGNWHSASTWGGVGYPNAATDNAIISLGHTVTVAQAATSYTVSNLTVNGTLTHSANTTVAATPYYTIDLTINGALSVAGTGMIDAKAKGFSAGNGPAAAGGSSGASHGGLGTGGSLPTYGSVTNPTTLGSGGSHTECVGGGAVILRVSGAVTVDGIIRADGGDKAGDWRRGASGGSVNLSADTLSGTGTVSASGSPLSYNYPAGGGGRVAVKLVSGTGTGSVALKAYGENNGGAPGTIYVQTTGQSSGQGTLIVDAGGRSVGETTLISTNVTGTVAGNVMLGTNVILAVASNTTLALSGNVAGNTTNAYLKFIGGTLTVPAAFSISNCTFWIANPSTCSPATSLTVLSNSVLLADVPHSIAGSMVVNGGGLVTHSANSTVAATPYKMVDLTIGGSLTVALGAAVNVKGRGFTAGNGPAPGVQGTRGASHGGLGYQVVAGYTTYGSITNPTTLGSGGGGGSAGAGGGAISLNVTGAATIDGILTADAADLGNSWYNGAAGGSINLAATELSGAGIITANGNTNQPSNTAGGGGGGRVAVKLSAGSDTGSVTIRAFGGLGGGNGAPGTVYLQTAGQTGGAGSLLVNAGGIAAGSGCSAMISTNVTDRQVGTLIITNSGVFGIASNVAFTVTSNFLNYAQTASLCATGGTFEVGGSGTMTIAGTVITNRFYNFTCTNAGKRIVFPSGSSNVLTGVLNLQGAAGNLLQLAGSGAGQWRLIVPSPSAMHTVKYVDVTNCNSWGGAEIQALDSIGKYNNNSNWSFSSSAAATNTWLGGSTSWIEGGNWSEGNVPTALQVVRITTANSPANWPILNTESTFMTLLLEADAQMSLGGNSMTVNTNLVVAGTLIASGIETVTLKGDANWAGGAFTKASSTVVIGGTGAQALDFSGITFNTLLAQNASALTIAGAFSAVAFTNSGGARTFLGAITAGSFVNAGGALSFSNAVTAGSFSSTSGDLTFGGNVTATNFSVLAPGVTLTFKDAATVTVTNLTLGGSWTNRMNLVSASPPATWLLKVSGASYVSGVTVSDSDASGGQTIRPVASTGNGNTPNWIFDGLSWKVWKGGSTDFHAAGNWDPAGAPGPGDSLLIERTNGIAAPVQTVAVTNANLAIGGLGPASLTLQAPMTVTNRVMILPQGVLTHTANGATAQYWIDLTVGGSLTVETNGAIDAKSKGFQSGYGTAPAGGGGTYAASHGGLGGMSTVSPYTTYGSVTNPTTLGSSGAHPNAGVGGGAIILRVVGSATVNGIIRADASDKTSDWVEGSSGGSVNLTAGTLGGSGVISANSHTNSYNYRGGGGGRVAVKLTAGSGTGGVALRAYGGPSSDGNGAPGTIYLQTAGQASGQGALIVDGGGNGSAAGSSALISTNMTDRQIATLIITNSGVFGIASNVTFTLTSNFLNYAQTASLCATGGTFEVGGSGTTTLGGTVFTNRFYNFTCTNAGKRIVFPSGSSNVLTGVLNLQGAEGNLLQLAGSGAGQWRLIVPAPSAMHTVKYVDVTNCNSWGGAEIQALDSIGKYNNNSNWSFSSSTAATNTWLGGSTSWIEGGNWSEGNAPTALQVVRITKANNPANWPILNTESTFMTLLLEADAQMSLGGNSMTVNTNLVVAGTLTATGTETVTIKGNADWTGGTFTKASSTVVIGGAGPQALDFSGIAFNNLASRNANTPLTLGGAFSAVTFTNTGSALTFANAISVGSLVNNSANLTFGAGFAVSNFYCVKAGITNTFKDGATYSITNLTLAGSAGNRLVLASSVPGGTKWKLNVSGLCSVSGVMVSDSDANDGQTIRPVASVEGTPGSTLNWDFGGGNAWKAWIGVTADFAAGGNWSPAGTPGVGDRLLIERTNGIAAPVLTNTLTVADLAIGGLAPALLTTKAPLTVTNRVAILEGGVLTHALNDDTNNPLYRLDLTVGGNLEIAPGGAIDVRGRGYAPNQGPAPGEPGSGYTYGACHGGVGGYTTPGPYTTYGSVTNPTLPGSGGGRLTVYANGAGGGVVLLRVTGNAQVDGLIRADAALTGGGFNPCGAGGSVNVLAGSMGGSGTISANGNMDESGSALMGGGGGRIAVKLAGGTSAGGVTLKAYGGGATRGASGSIYLQTGSQADGRGTLILDAGGYTASADATTLISTNVTDVTAGDVLIRNSASFALATNTAISVAGIWSNAATFAAVSNSVVTLAGTNTATVYGVNTFGILTITNDSRKIVYFQGARTNWVNGGLFIRNAGLYSTADGTPWHIRVASNAPQDVSSVIVKDSNATNGQTIVARPSSRDLENNVNWYFQDDPGSVFRMK